jgi:hypothetical protein
MLLPPIAVMLPQLLFGFIDRKNNGVGEYQGYGTLGSFQ